MKVSFVIPTLNSEKTLKVCLDSILSQNQPRDSYEIVIADAGSSDATVEIAKSAGVDKIVNNELKTGEAGKTAGIKAASHDIIALVDSDNVLPDSTWLAQMLAPFEDPDVVASEPLEYTVRCEDPALIRYFSMLGMSDPLCLFTGNYDRYCVLTNKWTGLNVPQEERPGWLKLTLSESNLPTMGANGFVFKRSLLEHVSWDPYFFDIDVAQQSVAAGFPHFAKVKCGIVHLYCTRLRDFSMKQRRRIRDFLFFAQAKQRTYPWNNHRKRGIVLFTLATVTIVPLIVQSLIGFCRKPDRAWLYHLPACWITLWAYGTGTLRKIFGFKQEPVKRDNWQTKE
ncbi:MAG: glycosyltransferase family 2 protein [Kiritimatiellia bacterium]